MSWMHLLAIRSNVFRRTTGLQWIIVIQQRIRITAEELTDVLTYRHLSDNMHRCRHEIDYLYMSAKYRRIAR